ncbi:MAG: hypothetical protein ABI665_28050 [Vicinamibacterales bacterium]
MWRTLTLLSLSFVVGCDELPARPSPAQLSGDWSGTFESSSTQTHAVTTTVTQAGSDFNGRWVTDPAAWEGTYSGTVDRNDRISGTITINMPQLVGRCDATAAFGGAVSQNDSTMDWNLSNFTGNCSDPPQNGRITVQRR